MMKFEVNQRAGKKISLKLWQGWIKKTNKVLKLKPGLEISIAVVGDSAIRKLNKLYRGKDRTTNVLSFKEAQQSNFLGEIIICYPQALRDAKIYKHLLNKELEILFVHGLLHLLGYDHKTNKQASKMEDLEEKILNN